MFTIMAGKGFGEASKGFGSKEEKKGDSVKDPSSIFTIDFTAAKAGALRMYLAMWMMGSEDWTFQGDLPDKSLCASSLPFLFLLAAFFASLYSVPSSFPPTCPSIVPSLLTQGAPVLPSSQHFAQSHPPTGGEVRMILSDEDGRVQIKVLRKRDGGLAYRLQEACFLHSFLDEIEAISQDESISPEKRVCSLSRGDIDNVRKSLAARPA
ncbi:hypothetical protein GUITHDRAFT_112520 [Guillardia theta CCMP2712]|uniref:Uncharacterized protein n=1 Tax=Guillardia theta (strain CCMP2712) TaxID=905079 RepID=L1IZK3_GUITC|nr:hypothetical protein GUITHDRAFT_112520 [Guillardia theta CCMP2712]EKX41309.1 hypothetical protein GUITHDRAFT_112520 [Guillardia theta CCMP2712]|eukprot:XP_005828289.1 hypothetical protein GUITHDRAFT_112520 [Guillardia theta CCMP2712]